MKEPSPLPLRIEASRPLRGSFRPVGDKSITHRALIFATSARGPSRLSEANLGEDCSATARAMDSLGASVSRTPGGWLVEGTSRRFAGPAGILDFGNSGTGIRLTTGLLAGAGCRAVLTGDDSLRRRPMRRIADPLRAMGASIALRDGEYAPIVVEKGRMRAAEHDLPIASAQVKGAILLAALGLEEGEVGIAEPGPSRDHTERMLEWVGVSVRTEERRLVLAGPAPIFGGFDLEIPADPSAAAFAIVAATLTEGSDVEVRGVCLNPTRLGFLDSLRQMGAQIEVEPDPTPGPEPTGSIRARAAPLRGIAISGDAVVRAIDEIPVLAIAAACATGETWIRDARELRAKESDRLATTEAMLRGLGVEAESGPDWLRIGGCGGRIPGGRVEAHADHRIAMSAVVAGCAARGPVELDDARSIAVSDPRFLERIAGLGAKLT